jgi:hypothetical protein
MWVCSYGVPECPICKRNRETREEAERRAKELARAQERILAGTLAVTVDRRTGKVLLNGKTDECLVRAIMVSGSALARAEIAKAQRLAGRSTVTTGR